MTKNNSKTSPLAAAMPGWLRTGASLAAAALLGAFGAPAASAANYDFQILAGNGAVLDHTDGSGTNARFFNPTGVAVDSAGNIYIADQGDHTIRKVTSSGSVTTFAGTSGQAGSADGTGTGASFLYPYAIAIDAGGNLYVTDAGNMNIRKITPAGTTSTLAGMVGQPGFADGPAGSAQFNVPEGIAVDASGNVYVSDTNNSTIRVISPSGNVSTVAGAAGQTGSADGTGSAARFNFPQGLAADPAGNVYVADFGNSTIRKIAPGGSVTTLAGSAGLSGTIDGQGSGARFNHPEDLAVDGSGNVFVIDTSNQTVRQISPGGATATLAGTPGLTGRADGAGGGASFFYPGAIGIAASGTLYIADTGNHSVRALSGGSVSTLAGSAGQQGSANASGTAATFAYPDGVAVDGSGNVYVADTNNNTIRKIAPGGAVSTLAGTAGPPGSADGAGGSASFHSPTGVAVDGSGNVYVADAGNSTIRKITAGGTVSTLAGVAGSAGSADGMGAAARFNAPEGIAVDGSGNVYVADTNNSTIREITSTGQVTTLAGIAGQTGSSDGVGAGARFDGPYAVAVDGSGNVYVADFFNATIRKVAPGGSVTTLAGVPQQPGFTDAAQGGAKFNQPYGVAVDGSGNVYVADTFNRAVRMVSSAGAVTTINGAGARFLYPQGIAVDGSGNIYVADGDNQAINLGAIPSATSTPPAGSTPPSGSSPTPGDVPPVAAIAVSGYTSGQTVAIAAGGSVTVSVLYSATDASNNLTGVRYNVWNPPAGDTTPFDGFFSNGSGFNAATGGSGQVSQTMTLTAGDWYFWTDAQNSNGDYASTGPWTAGFVLHVVAQ